jgi:hypothetical protein
VLENALDVSAKSAENSARAQENQALASAEKWRACQLCGFIIFRRFTFQKAQFHFEPIDFPPVPPREKKNS